jgi:hypothetical protein
MAVIQNKRTRQKQICQNGFITIVLSLAWILIVCSSFSERRTVVGGIALCSNRFSAAKSNRLLPSPNKCGNSGVKLEG